ncbi:unnamed protein product [Rhizophagus irregularis]|uniref:Uncharacterized protein n=1 Tax=Rhizophagus irregularis TaxID=588596 RepID=A0A915YX85_9GLOM|nr:hypothetical protein OCT59_006696 [Rhizophagus irregularis]GET58032.1 hypothetical protein RIR_jg27008.t2 [Rhizophagus irregularis DAOM 181602=DAOM 197198]CAB4374066.1 unnamed protein product [Rhizophagus irregularis]CAB4441833.1 unnamed protein product [Rhizophagus irregularis]CAB4441932.1 unnamed protein product [Rhizophagus irregularis]
MESSGSANKKDEIEGYEDDKSRTRIIALAVREAVAVAFGVNDADWNAACRSIIQNDLLTTTEKSTIIALLNQKKQINEKKEVN